mmetsp:Transcript_19865/g.25690  ORF Transcript_19865/g.25690 Transcript_19865/m.25690 type:complete len:493 (-) Transcript_19865:90-1568(-)
MFRRKKIRKNHSALSFYFKGVGSSTFLGVAADSTSYHSPPPEVVPLPKRRKHDYPPRKQYYPHAKEFLNSPPAKDVPLPERKQNNLPRKKNPTKEFLHLEEAPISIVTDENNDAERIHQSDHPNKYSENGTKLRVPTFWENISKKLPISDCPPTSSKLFCPHNSELQSENQMGDATSLSTKITNVLGKIKNHRHTRRISLRFHVPHSDLLPQFKRLSAGSDERFRDVAEKIHGDGELYRTSDQALGRFSTIDSIDLGAHEMIATESNHDDENFQRHLSSYFSGTLCLDSSKIEDNLFYFGGKSPSQEDTSEGFFRNDSAYGWFEDISGGAPYAEYENSILRLVKACSVNKEENFTDINIGHQNISIKFFCTRYPGKMFAWTISSIRVAEESSHSKFAEYQIVAVFGDNLFQTWKRSRQFKKLAKLAEFKHFDSALKVWEEIQKQAPWHQCLDAKYLEMKSRRLGAFLERILFCCEEPTLLLDFLCGNLGEFH